MPGIVLGDHLGDEGAVSRRILGGATAAQQQDLLEAELDVAVAALDGAVLVRKAAVVAARGHGAVPAQRSATADGVLGGFGGEVAGAAERL